VGKAGYVFGTWEGDTKDDVESMNGKFEDVNGFGFGFDVGAAWYFTSNIGVFAEVGFDKYGLKTAASYSYQDYDGSFVPGSIDIDVPFSRFLNTGISI
jgi:hypothetical protein